MTKMTPREAAIEAVAASVKTARAAGEVTVQAIERAGLTITRAAAESGDLAEARELLASAGRQCVPGHPIRPAIDEACDLVAAHRCTAEPEIVTGDEAADLPDGSIVKPADSTILPWAKIDGKWHRFGTKETPRELPDHGPWLVLYRAPEPVKPLAVGDLVTTAAELDRLPVDSVIRGSDGLLAWRGTAGDWHTNREDIPADVRAFLASVIEHGCRFRILDLPEGDE
jgi:hypothetical protein